MSDPRGAAGAPEAPPRVGLALAICAAIFILWQVYVMPPPPPAKPPTPAGTTPSTTPDPARPPGPVDPTAPPVGPAPVVPDRFPRTVAAAEATHEVTGGALKVRFTNRGGAVAAVELPLYRDPEQKGAHVLLRAFETDRPPLTVRLAGTAAAQADLPRAVWETLETTADAASYAYATGDGLRVVTRFTVARGPDTDPKAHVVRAEVRVENLDAVERRVELDLEGPAGISRERGQMGFTPPAGFVGYVPGTGRTVLERSDPTAVRAGARHKRIERGERLAFAGLTTSYFVAVLLPRSGADATLRQVLTLPVTPAETLAEARAAATRQSAAVPPDDELRRRFANNLMFACRHELTLPPAGPGGPGVQEFGYDLVVGPKSSELLRAFDMDGLREAGFTDVLSLPMLGLLRFFRAITGSYGLAIILLTLLVRGALHPLQFRMQLSMTRWSRKMKEVQPKLERIKKTITDPRRAQQEQMKVMREHGLRPPLGCLLPFLQMPVFIAIYQVFLTSVELRQATFLWIRDLSLPDHLFALPFGFQLPLCTANFDHLNLLPLLWIGAMQFQQKFSVVSLDDMTEEQKRQMQMMRWMTIVFGLMFYSVPSAAGLYVLTSTVVGFGEQAWIRARLRRSGELPPPKSALPTPAPAPAA